MVYKNFINRFIISIILIIIYLFTLKEVSYLFFFGLLIYLLIFFEIIKYFNKLKFYIILYLIISIISFILFFQYFYNFQLFNLIILIIVSFDSSSYFSGKLFGKKFIFKNISPKKTLEGYFGGLIITNLLCFVYYLFFLNNLYQINIYIFLTNMIIIGSLIGDLLQSYFKRKNNIKDSSNFLPGHGGFFDRFDSFMSTIIIIFIYSFLNQ